MKVYIKFLTKIYLKSFLYVTLVLFSLMLILNILSEIEFFTNIKVKTYFPIYLAFLNSPSLVFEMLPFIFLLSTQVFFVYLFNNDEIQIFKYSVWKLTNFKNFKFYNFSIECFTNYFFLQFFLKFKSYYLDLKTKFTLDGKYLAVVTNNGLWIRDVVNNKVNIINASKIDKNFLIDAIITEFDEDFNVIRNIRSNKIDIENKEWLIFKPKVFNDKTYKTMNSLKFKSNFDYQKIQNLYSNLSSLSVLELLELRKTINY